MDNSARAILLVEDGEDDVFLLKHSFAEAKIANPVQVAKDCAEAIRYLSGEGEFADRSKNPLPVLVLLDLKMPRMDGFDVLRWKSKRPELSGIPFFVLSSSNLEQDVTKALELGARQYFVKPMSLDELVEMVQLLDKFCKVPVS